MPHVGWVFALFLAAHFAVASAQGQGPVAPVEALLARAQALANQGRAEDAYGLLAGAEDEHLGDPRFDYALGRAALDAGRPSSATLAFGRVLAVDPHHAGALIDTGRAYLALGNYEQAQATFESLLGSDPPPALRAQLQGYLEQARRGVPSRPSFAGYLLAGLGASSNVNQSPGQSSVFVPLFNARFDLAADNVRKADRFWTLGGGVEGAYALNRTFSLVGGADLLTRQNFRESAFNLGGAGVRFGVAAVSGLDLLRLQWVQTRNYVGHDPNREVGALSAEGFKTLGPDDQLLATAQAGRLRYVPEGLRVFDADFATFGTGLAHRFDGGLTLSVGISAGRERDVGGNPDGNKRQAGLQGAFDLALRPRWSLHASLALQRTGYDRENPVFLAERRDDRGDLEISLRHILADALSVRFGATMTRQRSRIPIYEFDRNEVWVMVRREFR